MGELKRYDNFRVHYSLEEASHGEWVKHSDAAAKIADLERAVEVLAEVCAKIASDDPDADRDFIAWKIRQITNPIAQAALEAARREGE